MNWLRNIIESIIEWIADLKEGQRRVLLAGLLLLGAAIIGFLIYWIFFRSLLQEEKVNINGELVNVSQLPDILPNANREIINVNEDVTLPDIDVIAKGGETLAQVIYDGDAQHVTMNADGESLQYYDEATGRFFRIDANGNLVELSDKTFKGVENASWDDSGNRAVLEFLDGSNIVYDFNTEKQFPLNEDMEEFDFSPNGNQISYKYMADNPADRWLGIAEYDGSGVIGIEHLGENEETVNAQWSPSGQSIGTYERGVDGIYNEVIPLGFRGENFKKMTVKGRGFDYEWSPNGRQMIYSTYDPEDDYNYSLHITDAYGDDIGKNNISLELKTNVDQCAFNARGDAVYCAVPVDPPIGTAISEDRLKDLQHDFYKVDLNTGTTQKLATPSDGSGYSLDVPESVIVTDSEDILYYTEKNTGRVRRIILK